MKIGVLTYHCVPNFGAQLQTISTVGYLKKLGHNPIVLNWYPIDLEEMYDKRIPANQIVEHLKFAEQNMPLSKLCRTENELIAEIERLNIDAIFAGSDALFKYIPESKRVVFSKKKFRFIRRKILTVQNVEGNCFFGNFIAKLGKKIKAVAFSISSQNCDYAKMDDSERDAMRMALNNYLKISVRDEWTKQMVCSITKRDDIDITPDPVFAFNQNCYLAMPSKKEILAKYSLPENYVLLSFWTNHLNKDYVQGVAQELEENGLMPVAFPMPERLQDFNLEYKIDLPLSPLDWYALIKYSKGYIGERMHPIVVCLHNAIPFFCFDEYGTFKKSIFGFCKKYIPSSSKTFHILENAGLSEWRHSYFDQNRKMPDCSLVVNNFLKFPVSKCVIYAQKKQQDYNNGVNEILNYLM